MGWISMAKFPPGASNFVFGSLVFRQVLSLALQLKLLKHLGKNPVLPILNAHSASSFTLVNV
jgi:hypothetical protein